ncbi:CBO0543 family protein [Ammoniphilus sp. CFH 90114]|uniref:CBO0543 family protein n=1 Tax=Ammoniphilus sp. CFH 90114 TaxID=2493665 RepID=UPI00100DEF8B|nr:CBO0543 family protein [Ammoniphilus sp. CFH 90114]RXT03947.1 hypothetical protein EIZ39_22595 [Ammoniphilus sp. CFH 90114]
MSVERIFLVCSWFISGILLLLFVPKKKIPQAIIILLFAQTLSWISGILLVMFDLVRFPVREFSSATNVSFSRHFVVYPTIFVLFALYYPIDWKKWAQGSFIVLFASMMTMYAYFTMKYTSLIEMENGVMYLLFMVFVIHLYSSIRFFLWFQKGMKT